MLYYHVIVKLEFEESVRVLFSDLSEEKLIEKFIIPYQKGTKFFSGNDLISPETLQSVQIISTNRTEETEREEIYNRDLKDIDRLNNSDSNVFFLSIPAGYQPEDIVEVGDDVTHSFLGGGPGFKANRWSTLLKIVSWVVGIVTVVLTAGLIKWFGLQ